MPRKLSLLLLLLITLQTAVSAQLNKSWSLLSPYIEDESGAIHTQDRKGNTFLIHSDFQNQEMFVQKHNVYGQQIWKEEHATLNWGNNYEPTVAIVDPYDNLYVYGKTLHSDIDPILIKFDPEGQFLWGKMNQFPFDDELKGMAVDANGNVTIAFYTEGVGNRVLTLKTYAPDGTFKWDRTIQNTYMNFNCIRYAENGDLILVAGWPESPISDRRTHLVRIDQNGNDILSFDRPSWEQMVHSRLTEIPGKGYYYVYAHILYKLDLQGRRLWEREIDLRTIKVLVTPDDGVVALGVKELNTHTEIRGACFEPNGTEKWSIAHRAPNGYGQYIRTALIGKDGRLYMISKHLEHASTLLWSFLSQFVLYEVEVETGEILTEKFNYKYRSKIDQLSINEDEKGNIYASGLEKNDADELFRFTNQYCGWNCNLNVLGTVFHDKGADCGLSPSDSPIPYRIIEINDGQFHTLADEYGHYRILLPPGQHTISPILSPYWQESCQTDPITIDPNNPQAHIVDFPLDMIPDIMDMRVNVSLGPVRAGFSQTHTLLYENVGTAPHEGVVALELDPIFTYLSANPEPDSSDGDTFYWEYDPIQPGQSGTIHLTTSLSTDPYLVGKPFTNCATIESAITDQTPADNIDCFIGEVTGSSPSNDKTAFPTTLHPGELDISYLVRFQNTGTDTAYTLVIRDTISPLLDLTTLKMGATSHPFTLALNPGRELVWTFKNILLPASSQNELLSHGYLQYKIQTHPNLPLQAEVPNTAAISFDSTPAIFTNTAITTVTPFHVGGTPDPDVLRIYPNPASSYFQVDAALTQRQEYVLTVSDLRGREVIRQEEHYEGIPVEVSAEKLREGLYLIRLISDGKTWTGKLIRFEGK